MVTLLRSLHYTMWAKNNPWTKLPRSAHLLLLNSLYGLVFLSSQLELSGWTHSQSHACALFAEDTLSAAAAAAVGGGGETRMQRMRAHSGYSLQYCRQHSSSLSSLFSAYRPSGDKELQRERGRERENKTRGRNIEVHIRTMRRV